MEPPEPRQAHKAVAFALEHLFERRSVVDARELVTEALKWGYGRVTVEGVQAAVKEFPLIRVEKNGRELITTREVLREEQRITTRCQAGKGKLAALNPDWAIEDRRLNPQQRAAVFHVLHSRDLITGISGKAGTGKTTLLKEAARGIEAGGSKLLVLAPTAEAAHGVLAEQGFEYSETVAKLLTNESLQEEARGAVWWVDEAGLLSSRSMDKLLTLAEQQGARLVLVGDTGQHHAVERGQAFDLLEKRGDMAVASVDKIQRQRGAYKKAVEQIAELKFADAFQTLEEMGAFRELPFAERGAALAADYVATVEAGKSALVVSPTHAECEAVTYAIRHTLKEKELIKEGTNWPILRNRSWTAAQKRDPQHYAPGLVVKINRHVKGFALGEQAEVVGVTEDTVTLAGQNGECKTLPWDEAEKFSVYEKDAVEVCAGDRLRVTANSRSADGHRLNNGSLYTVKDIDPDGKIVLENGWRLDQDFGHLDYGYATTSHASQGKTVDRVLVAQSGLLSSGGSDAKQFYVSVSRGRECVHIYTDDIEALREHVARVRERPMAMEVVPEGELVKAAEEKPELAVEVAPEQKASRELGKTAGESETLQALIEEIASAVAERENVAVPEKVQEWEQARAAVPQIAREPEREVVMEM